MFLKYFWILLNQILFFYPYNQNKIRILKILSKTLIIQGFFYSPCIQSKKFKLKVQHKNNLPSDKILDVKQIYLWVALMDIKLAFINVRTFFICPGKTRIQGRRVSHASVLSDWTASRVFNLQVINLHYQAGD